MTLQVSSSSSGSWAMSPKTTPPRSIANGLISNRFERDLTELGKPLCEELLVVSVVLLHVPRKPLIGTRAEFVDSRLEQIAIGVEEVQRNKIRTSHAEWCGEKELTPIARFADVFGVVFVVTDRNSFGRAVGHRRSLAASEGGCRLVVDVSAVADGPWHGCAS
ncbi:MAG: hypothetical protein QM756_36035 [Polyangiaceae bacterium]